MAVGSVALQVKEAVATPQPFKEGMFLMCAVMEEQDLGHLANLP